MSQTAITQLYRVKNNILKVKDYCFWFCVIQVYSLQTETESPFNLLFLVVFREILG